MSTEPAAQRVLESLRRVLSHDLPNHLVTVQGLAQMLEMDEQDRLSADGRDYLQRLSGAAHRAHTLIRALADLAEIGLRGGSIETVSLGEVIREAAAAAKHLCQGRNIEYHLLDSPMLLRLPPGGLRQVLVHLIHNGVQAVGDERRPRIEVGARLTPAGQEVWVADNGRGLSPEQLRRVQEYLAGRETRAPSPGLGLLLLRLTLETWGGSARVESQPGQGSKFTLVIPGASEG
jgi:signal transduction histidine kinase